METTTQFPVNPGTVVEVTCSYSDAVNEGDNKVTCTSGTEFTFYVEPSCSIPGILLVTNHLILLYSKVKSL